jgi:RNA polymerase sigma factor (sigma-70 family)
MRSFATQLARQLPDSTRTDGELLSGFLTDSSLAESDFAELVRRHGPLVWAVCRRALPDVADAEDAFQAVFIVLVRRANQLTASQTIAPWLHRVATWTTRNLRRRNARQSAKRVPLSDQIATPTSDPDLSLDLDAALLSLPDKYRSPVVLCHLLGFSRADAAAKLGCPEGTLSAWLSRGLAKLRAKLRGLDPTKLLTLAAVAVPLGLSSSVVRAAVTSRLAVESVAISSAVSQIVEGVIHMFWVKKVTAVTMALFATFALGVGVGLSGRQAVSDASGQDKTPTKPDPNILLPEAHPVAKIQSLESQIVTAMRSLEDAVQAVKINAEKVAALKSKNADPRILQKELEALAAAQKLADDTTATLVLLKNELAKLKATPAQEKPQPRPDTPSAATQLDMMTRLSELRAELNSLALARQKLADLEKQLARETEDNDLRRKKVWEETKKLETTLKELAPAARAGAYLELTAHGKQSGFEYSITETDASGKVIGRVITHEPEMLAKLLARTKNDTTAPKELRVVIDPSLAITGHPTIVFKACDAAGYKTIKFTGYIPYGNFLQELKSEQRGEVPGHTRYDNAECVPANLLKNIEDWRRTY